MTMTIPARRIKTRRIGFDQYDGIPHYFMNDDPVMSHIVAALSSVFPEGEDFFVESVRDVRDTITDPELRKQVGGFIGQEAIHGREHRDFNKWLAELGYPTWLLDRLVHYGFRLRARYTMPKSWRLAVTAALEHYTATLAEVLLREEVGREMFTSDEVRKLFLWHAVEESEHKSVAFDVFQAYSGNQRVRTGIMNLVTVMFLGLGAIAVTGSIVADRETYRDPAKVVRGIRRLRRNPWLTNGVPHRIRDYNRRDFHPDDHPTDELLAEWRERLFGDEGELAGRVKGAKDTADANETGTAA